MIDTTYRWPMMVAVIMMTVLMALSQNAKGGQDLGNEPKESDAVHMGPALPREFSLRR